MKRLLILLLAATFVSACVQKTAEIAQPAAVVDVPVDIAAEDPDPDFADSPLAVSEVEDGDEPGDVDEIDDEDGPGDDADETDEDDEEGEDDLLALA